MFPLHSCTNPYRIVQDTKRNIRKITIITIITDKILTTRMVIFYNPTEARSTLSFNTLLIYLSSLRSLVLHGDHGEDPLPTSPSMGRRKSTQSPRCCLYIERVCSEHSSERGSNPALTLGGDGGGFSVPLSVEKNNLYGFSFAQRCILELSEALSLTKGK